MEQIVIGEEVHEFWNDSEIALNILCLENISKDFSAGNMENKTGLNGYVYHVSVDYAAVSIIGISHIHKYLMIQNGTV